MRSRPFLHGAQLATAVHVDGGWSASLLPTAAHGGPGNDRGALPRGLRVCERHDHSSVQERRVLPRGIGAAAALRRRVVVQRRRQETDGLHGGDLLPGAKHESDTVRRGAVVEQPGQAVRGLRGGEVPAERRQGGLHRLCQGAVLRRGGDGGGRMRSRPFLHGTQLATAVHICGRLLPSGPDVDPGANRGRLSGRLRVRERHDQEAMRRWIVLPSTIERRAQLHGRLVVLHQHLSRCALRPVRARPLFSRSAAASCDPSASIHCLSCCALGRPSLQSATTSLPQPLRPPPPIRCVL